MSNYIKLSTLVGQRITIISVDGFGYKKWDEVNRRILFSPSWIQGYRKLWKVETDKGIVDISDELMGKFLTLAMRNGVSDIIQKTYEIKSNGKTGIEIRYYAKLVKDEPRQPQPQQQTEEVPF